MTPADGCRLSAIGLAMESGARLVEAAVRGRIDDALHDEDRPGIETACYASSRSKWGVSSGRCRTPKARKKLATIASVSAVPPLRYAKGR